MVFNLLDRFEEMVMGKRVLVIKRGNKNTVTWDVREVRGRIPQGSHYPDGRIIDSGEFELNQNNFRERELAAELFKYIMRHTETRHFYMVINEEPHLYEARRISDSFMNAKFQ